MSLLSYAQNGEDVVLYRALIDVEQGHYIDIGARDPTEGSATKLFYDRGWSGVNVEPSRAHHARLRAERDRDLNVNVAVAARPGIARIYRVPSEGLSTLAADVAAAARRRGLAVEELDAPVLTLEDVCRDLPFSTTHFLRIGAEGGERDVLRGGNFARFRPWIVVVEATAPLGTDRTDEAWRGILESAGYDCVLFDGLNLYFLAAEKGELRGRLAVPANVRDDFVPARLVALPTAERDALASAVAAERARSEALEATVAALGAERDRLGDELRRLTEDLIEARVTLRLVGDSHQGELAGARREMRFALERQAAELAEAGERLARLAHFESQARRMREIAASGAGGGSLADRGAEILELRAGLLHHANAWRAEVDLLQDRLAEAAARFASLQRSTSWRVTSPLRGFREATHVLRREPRRLSALMRRRARRLMGRPEGVALLAGPAAAEQLGPPPVEAGVDHLSAVAARLDGEMTLITGLLGSVSAAFDGESPAPAGPSYAEARLDEQLTRWILGEVGRQRRAAL